MNVDLTASCWVPQWATWVPVWATLDGQSRAMDALESAVLDLFAIGAQDAQQIASQLCIATELVESAASALIARGRLVRHDEGGHSKVGDEDQDSAVPNRRAGWVAWDPTQDAPIFDLLLGPEDACSEFELAGSEGLSIGPMSRISRPGFEQIDRELGLLPQVGVRVFELGAGGVARLGSAHLRELRRRLDERLVNGPIWTPVEFRLGGNVVWRPGLAPLDDRSTGLSPGGWEGLLGQLDPGQRADLQARHHNWLTCLAPELVEKAGFGSIEELRRWSAHSCDQELGAGETEVWPDLRAAITAAFEHQVLAHALASPAGGVGRGWADVLEILSLHMLAPATAAVHALRLPLPRDEAAASVAVRGMVGDGTWSILRKLRSDGDGLSKLKRSLGNDKLTIGGRLLAMAMAAWADSGIRQRFDGLRCEGLYETRWLAVFAEALSDRNAIVHPGTDKRPVNVTAFRRRVLALCRAAVASNTAVVT